MYFVATIGIVFCLYTAALSAKLPASWGRCHKSNPEFDECLRTNVEDAIHKLKNPTPELKLDSFDPLDINELYIGEGKGAVNLVQHFTNVKLHGLTNAIVKSFKIDFVKNEIRASSLNPELRLQGDYDVNGRVLLLPIVGHGPCNVTLLNMDIDHTLTLETFEKKGKSYLRVKDFKVVMRPEKVIYKFDNLFDGQKDLGDNVNKVINDNSAEVFEDVRSGYEKSFALIFLDLANRVLPKVPQEDIFLE
ncbi:protein takeout-like [Cylas formicarius]|uniref:protein takeout-like n=1 Tax=Cylas formicarius TaxID=197179 RepID=UPI002958697F|nr:protein takeout-like [Cylas formicarius]